MWRSLLVWGVLLFEVWGLENYRILQGCTQIEGENYALLRSFQEHNTTYFWGIHTQTLEPKRFTHTQKIPCPADSRYERLKQHALQANRTVNGGITQSTHKGMALTVDMCPSSKQGYETPFYEALMNHQIPVTVSITGRWIAGHAKEFEALKKMHQSGRLTISWMNHGHVHPYDRSVSIEENFINLPEVDFDAEVVELEKLLFSHALVPSVFYRFAGLVSNTQAYARLVRHFGLIPVGSRAWLAKNEPATEGSIILVHGNLNEPDGIKRARELFTKSHTFVTLESLLSMTGKCTTD